MRLIVKGKNRRDLCCAMKLTVVCERSHEKCTGIVLLNGEVHNETQGTALQRTQKHWRVGSSNLKGWLLALRAQQIHLNPGAPNSTPARSTLRSSDLIVPQ